MSNVSFLLLCYFETLYKLIYITQSSVRILNETEDSEGLEKCYSNVFFFSLHQEQLLKLVFHYNGGQPTVLDLDKINSHSELICRQNGIRNTGGCAPAGLR